jgi:hypothetical protein
MPIIPQRIGHKSSLVTDRMRANRRRIILKLLQFAFGLIIPKINNPITPTRTNPLMIMIIESDTVHWNQSDFVFCLELVAFECYMVFLYNQVFTMLCYNVGDVCM